MNLAQHLNRFYQDLGEANTNTFPIALVKDWLDEAERVITKKTKCVHGEQVEDLNAWSDTYTSRLHSFPTGLLGYAINNIYVSDNNNVNERKEIRPITIAKLNRDDRLWRTRKGTPIYWFLDLINQKWGLFRYPSVATVTNMVRVAYRKAHTKMTRYYSTGTLAITNGATTVTLTSGGFTGNVAAGDKIGIGKLLDRTTAFPTTWYTVASITDNTHLEISTAFSETTVTASNFIASAASTILHDELNQCAVILAMAMALGKDKDWNGRSALQSEALGRIQEEKYRLDKQDRAFSNEPSVPHDMMPSPGTVRDDYGISQA